MDDDDKSIIEKTIERVKDIAAKASEKAHKAMEREPIKPGDEVVMMSEAAPIGDPVMPPFVIIPGRKKASKQTSKKPAIRTASAKNPSKKKRKKKAAKPSKPVSKKAAKKKKKSKKSKR